MLLKCLFCVLNNGFIIVKGVIEIKGYGFYGVKRLKKLYKLCCFYYFLCVLGCVVLYILVRCWKLRCVYIWVVDKLVWFNNFCIVCKLLLDFNMCVVKEWCSLCGLMVCERCCCWVRWFSWFVICWFDMWVLCLFMKIVFL